MLLLAPLKNNEQESATFRYYYWEDEHVMAKRLGIYFEEPPGLLHEV